MSEQTLHNSVENSGDVLLKNSIYEGSNICCCISYKWCFDHTGIPIPKEYNKTEYNCCTCLDFCTWCLEFRIKKCLICSKNTNCYLCCFSIYFTEE